MPVKLSLTASISATDPLLPLFAVFVSLLAPVVPLTATDVSVVSVPPTVPGITTVIPQVSVAPIGRLAALPELATHDPVLTPLPLATQLAFVAAAGPLFVQVIVPLTVLPGAATAGSPLIAEVMSALVSATTTCATALSHTGSAEMEQIW
jgi:hypothetical protein